MPNSKTNYAVVVIGLIGPGDSSPPEDEPVYECQSCAHMFADDDSRFDKYELRICPECGSDDVVRYT